MRKLIKIDNKDYLMQSSAYTQFAYKNETGRSLLKDLQSVVELTKKKKNEDYGIDELDAVTDLILKVAYVMTIEADDKQYNNYVEFIKSIDNLYDDQTWIQEVITLACAPLSRQLQNIN